MLDNQEEPYKLTNHQIRFLVRYVERSVMIKNRLYHDQPTLKRDLQKLRDTGMMPSGLYKIYSKIGIETTWGGY